VGFELTIPEFGVYGVINNTIRCEKVTTEHAFKRRLQLISGTNGVILFHGYF